MADPESNSLIKSHFFQPLLPGFHDFLNIPVKFFKKHIEERDENKTAKLKSDASYKTWEVKMEGQRFTDGWKEFVKDHDFRIGDFVAFRHEGGLDFHVTGFGPSCCNLKYASSGSDYKGKSDKHNIGNASRKMKKVNKRNRKTTTNYTFLEVTASNLKLDRRFVPMVFARSNGLTKRWCKIELMNEHGRSWTSDLRWRKKDGLVYIGQGWRSFCNANGLEAGSYCKFKMIGSRTRPVLQLCTTESSDDTNSREEECSEANERKCYSTKPPCRGESSSRERSKRKETTKTLSAQRASTSSGQSRFVILHLSQYLDKTGQLRLPTRFTMMNGIKESGEATLVDKHGVEWPSHLHLVKGCKWFYISGGSKGFLKANGVKIGESFVLELIWGDMAPIFKFCSEIQQELHHGNGQVIESPERVENQTETKAGVNALKRRTRETAEKPIAAEGSPTETETKTLKRDGDQCPVPDPDQENRSKHQEDRQEDPTKGTASESSQGTQSDPMAKAKQRIADALTTIQQFREVLDRKEQKLEASLRKLDAL